MRQRSKPKYVMNIDYATYRKPPTTLDWVVEITLGVIAMISLVAVSTLFLVIL